MLLIKKKTQIYFVTKLIIESAAKDYKRQNFIAHYNEMNQGLETHRSVDFDKVNETLTSLIETVVLKKDTNYTISDYVYNILDEI